MANKPNKRNFMNILSRGEEILAAQWEQNRDLPPYEREYQFNPTRKFRLDFAVPVLKFGVEIEGGLWTKGAHSTPTGILRDMEKGNLLVMDGWSVLRYSTQQVRIGIAIDEIATWFSDRSMHIIPAV
jgi:very-short-patch-repair endonuclease